MTKPQTCPDIESEARAWESHFGPSLALRLILTQLHKFDGAVSLGYKRGGCMPGVMDDKPAWPHKPPPKAIEEFPAGSENPL